MVWQVQEAKNKLSEVIERALKEGPQTITRHGQDVAVLISCEEFRELTRPKQTLVEFFQRSPLAGVNLSIQRNKDSRLRKVGL
jgi:antitoxin Phd